MIKFGKWIAKHKVIIVIISMLLLIPSFLGMAATRVNYDILSYLPESLETVEGQDIMVDEFGMGAFSMVVVEDMELKDVAALKEKFQNVEHVKDVLWYDSVADLSIPVSMIPEKFKDGFFNGDATMMIALFDNTTSSDAAMEAVSDMRKIANVSSVDGVDRLIEQRCQWDRVERLVGSDHHAPPPLFFGCSFTLPHSMPWGNWGCGLPDGLFFAIIYYQFPRQQPAWVKEGHFLAYWWKETAYGYVFSVGPGGGLVQHGRDGAADRGGAAVPGGP